jgi:hypothetical protein
MPIAIYNFHREFDFCIYSLIKMFDFTNGVFYHNKDHGFGMDT